MFPEIMLDNFSFLPNYLRSLPERQRYIVAGNDAISISVLEQLAGDQSAAVRRHVAENPRTPAWVLVDLSNDFCPDVRLTVAEHRATPRAILEYLSQDESSDVRYGIAENHNVPMHILQALSEDDNPFVACRARQTLRLLEGQSPRPATLRRKLTDQASKLEHMMKTWQDIPRIHAV